MINHTAHTLLFLLSLFCLSQAWGAESASDYHQECINEPVFEGKVCTIEANRHASTGVIMIHGLDGSTDDWKRTIPELARNFHVIAFDLPGFGKSDKGSQEYSPTRYARLAQYLVNHYFQDKPFHVVGHSMGGAIALRFASQQPLRFKRLVLLDAAGILHPLVITKFQAGSMLQKKSGVQQTRGFAEKLSGRILEKLEQFPISPTDIVNTAMGRERVLQGGPSYIAALDLAGEDFSYAVTSVSNLTLVIWGDNDLVAPLRTGRVLADNMPHARLEVIAQSGHEPMLDQPRRMNDLIKQHLLDSDDALAARFKVAPAQPSLSSTRVAKCTGESGKVYKGDYLAIELRDCDNITIRNARIGHLSASNSQLSLIDTDILGKDVGLQADDSVITATNGNISGKVAIHVLRSHLDLAGVHMKGSEASINATNSKLICSICEIHSPHGIGRLHTFKSFDSEEM